MAVLPPSWLTRWAYPLDAGLISFALWGLHAARPSSGRDMEAEKVSKRTTASTTSPGAAHREAFRGRRDRRSGSRGRRGRCQCPSAQTQASQATQPLSRRVCPHLETGLASHMLITAIIQRVIRLEPDRDTLWSVVSSDFQSSREGSTLSRQTDSSTRGPVSRWVPSSLVGSS